MPADRDMLKRLASDGHAVMEIDYGEKVTAWNRQAEKLLGIPAREALGRPCYEVLQGRDAFGNRYCHRACPIAHQARFDADDPVRTFPLDVEARPGGPRRVILSTFAVSSPRPSLAPIVHVFRKAPTRAGSLRPAALETAVARLQEPTRPGALPVLTSREKEVLRSIAEGLPTQAIAEKLGILTVTVRNHVQAILRRLKVHSRLAAVHMARQHKLL